MPSENLIYWYHYWYQKVPIREGHAVTALMSIHTMPVSEVRKALNALLGGRRKPIIITQHGYARGVLIDIETYNALVDELDDARDDRDAELARAVADAKAADARGGLVPLAEVLREHGL